jgi:hypothetical protein
MTTYLNTYNTGSYTLQSSVGDTPLLLKFDYNERLDQWMLTITSDGVVLLGSKALTPDAILLVRNLDLGLVFTVYAFSPKPISTPISLWSGYYYIAIGD